jgi:uncharacterized protein
MSAKNIVGRGTELAFLEDLWLSKNAEFVAVYGRRRVGKTHLIREYFAAKGDYFEVTGLKDGNLHDQLFNFAQCFAKAFYPDLHIQPPNAWQEAFELLTQQLKNRPSKKKITLFFDELPWLATKRSKFIQNLDYYWNTQWSTLPNVKLIVCGSAASWMLDNLINAKGGLYNRLTNTLLLRPFNLAQTKAFLKSRNINFSNKQLLDIYMITGGIPHYLKRIKRSRSAIQNINELCFMPDGLLFDEFPRLFSALFENAELNLQIVREIAKSRYGITMQQLSDQLGKKTGGTFTNTLHELEAAGFIQRYVPYDRKKRDQYYRVIDEYTFFYLSWIEEYKERGMFDEGADYWHLASQTSAWKSWAGYAFESICYKHIHQIRHALHIDNIHCHSGHWRMIATKNRANAGAQIDLLIDRDDGIINLCEIKYNYKQLIIDKTIAMNLMKKIEVYQQQSLTQKQISVVFITTAGVKESAWSKELIDHIVTLDSLF